MSILTRLKMVFTHGSELEEFAEQEKKRRIEKETEAKKFNLRLCEKHQQESQHSIYSEHNCDYCILLRINEEIKKKHEKEKSDFNNNKRTPAVENNKPVGEDTITNECPIHIKYLNDLLGQEFVYARNSGDVGIKITQDNPFSTEIVVYTLPNKLSLCRMVIDAKKIHIAKDLFTNSYGVIS